MLASLASFSATGSPHRLFRRCEGEERHNKGRQKQARERFSTGCHFLSSPFSSSCRNYFNLLAAETTIRSRFASPTAPKVVRLLFALAVSRPLTRWTQCHSASSADDLCLQFWCPHLARDIWVRLGLLALVARQIAPAKCLCSMNDENKHRIACGDYLCADEIVSKQYVSFLSARPD